MAGGVHIGDARVDDLSTGTKQAVDDPVDVALVARDGMARQDDGVVVVVTVDIETGKVLVGPEIITRGWVYAPEAEDLLDEACDIVQKAIEQGLKSGIRDIDELEKLVRRAAGKFVSERTRRRPMIVPVVMGL